MSQKVYMYIGTIAGFLAYAIFIGYFPDFSKDSDDPKRDMAQKQPRFIEILFEYIMLPLALALTAVLLIWSVKTVITGEQVPFMRLSSIAAGFATVGLWLHIMVTHGQSAVAGFYRRIFPLAAIIILVFEARALFMQIEKWGIKNAEYSFILIWILTMAAVILLIIMKSKSHVIIAALICGLAVFSVLPVLGFHVLPVKMQTIRLEKMLTVEGMFQGGVIVPAVTEPEKSVKEAITDAVSYLANTEDVKLPSWFDPRLSESAVFKQKFGFEQSWPGLNGTPQPNNYMTTNLYLPAGAVDISGYRWAVNILGDKETVPVTIEGEKGSYNIYWNIATQQGVPAIRIELDGRTIYEADMKAYVDRILAKYLSGTAHSPRASFEDMSYYIEIPEAKILLVFGSVTINTDTRTGNSDCWMDLRMLFMRE